MTESKSGRNIWDVGFLGAEPQRANEIDFTPAYVEIDSTYLVPPGSTLKHADEVDRKGIRIIVPAKAAYELYLSRTIKHAELVREAGADASFKRFVAEKFDAKFHSPSTTLGSPVAPPASTFFNQSVAKSAKS